MPIKRHHLPVVVPATAGVAALGVLIGARSLRPTILSDGFCAVTLLAIAGAVAVAIVLDLVLVSHGGGGGGGGGRR